MKSEIQSRILKKFIDETTELNDVDLIFLKGHLLIEEVLTIIIENYVWHSKFLQLSKLTFYQKIQIARSISLDESENDMWKLIEAINTYRNKLAHSLDETIHQKRINSIFDLYFEILSDEASVIKQKENPTKQILSDTILVVLGFLGNFEAEIKRFKNLIVSLDKEINTHRHPTN